MTGIPYAVFKLGAGWFLQASGRPWLGWPMVVWGAFDLLANLTALAAPRLSAYCLLAELGRRLDRRRQPARWESLMLSVDTLVTLVIVSAMIWFGAIPALPSALLVTWNVAVVANITGVGIQRVWLSARQMV